MRHSYARRENRHPRRYHGPSARGVLDDITHDESVEFAKEEQVATEEPSAEVVAVEGAPQADGEGEQAEAEEKKKKPRKLIEDEKREACDVKCNIYNTYMKAS